MSSNVRTTNDVYGISRDLPLNYVTRVAVDNKLVENLSRQNHIVIHGSSKQGKTSLRKYCLQDGDYITIQCSNRWDLTALHEAVLKRAGFQTTLSSTKTTAGKAKLLAKFSASFLGTGGSGGGEVEIDHSRSTETAPLEIDAGDVNDVIHALSSIKFNRLVVLEDFHYLPPETQRDFAVALKAFHEGSKLCFVIIGVWLEENRLIVYNGDLTGRVVSINADVWSADELMEVVNNGANHLNISFNEDFTLHLINQSFSNVYIVQEACRRLCERECIFETLAQPRCIGSRDDVSELVTKIVDEQSARYRSFLTQFSDGFQDSELRMYRWILFPVITSKAIDLRSGITYSEMKKLIQQFHPAKEGLNSGNLTIALQSVAALQSKKSIKPIVLDYDETQRRLRVVDRGFIIWLSKQNPHDVLETVGFEKEAIPELLSRVRT